MSDSNSGDIAAAGSFIIVVLVVVFIGIAANRGYRYGVSETTNKIRQEAVDNNVAYYNPTNAVFTWKTNLVEQAEKGESNAYY